MQNEKTGLVNLLIVYVTLIIAKIADSTVSFCEISFLNQRFQINKIGVPCKCGKGLVRRVPKPSRPKRQYLPDALSGLFQKVHKLIGLPGKCTNPIFRRNTGYCHQYSTLSHTRFPFPPFTPIFPACRVSYTLFSFQISLLYSSIVLSDEKNPDFAIFTSIIRFHFARFS